jgi:hypothetical protein
MRTKRWRIAAYLALSLIGVALSWYFGREFYWRSYPEAAFTAVTGRTLPVGVHASAYRSRLSDNLFHATHYWLLSGEPDALKQVVSGTGFERSDDDARSMLPDMERIFDVSLSHSQVVAGYEWELPRNRWYLIFAGERNALYTH